jgi:LuxR family transcriptional activator of conjugal transfer of Ti plasmids
MNRPLSPSQALALSLASQGHTAKESAQLLNLSPHTMKDHILNACHRIGAKNVTHAVALALASGQISAADVEAA